MMTIATDGPISLTQDIDLIESIINRDDIYPGFCGEKATRAQIEREDIVYFLYEGVGLFPVNLVDDKTLMVNAAVPTENRGIKAIKAAREILDILVDKGFKILTRTKREKHLKAFVRLVGFKPHESKGPYDYYKFEG